MIKFGKKSKDILEVKSGFIADNLDLFNWQKKLYKIYIKQPKRSKCKNCEKKLKGLKFSKLNVLYILCKNCGHLNGLYDDTEYLSKKFYQTSEQKTYSKIYVENKKKDYNKRLKNIYIPKAKFLLENLIKKEKDKKKIFNKFKFIDIGCGSGYFISSLHKMKIKNLSGFDPSKEMVDYGNKANRFKKLEFVEHDKTIDKIKRISGKDPTCISMIGSLEHIYNQNKILKVIKSKKNIKYLYIVVPCFSPSSFIEMVFDKNFQRLLAPQHTHLYSEKSLKYLEKMFDFKIIAEWWFGADIVDLYRNFFLKICNKKKLNDEKILFNNMFLKILDGMQLEIDKKKLSSEAHILFKVN
jgi:2-polyprenyl-3-methyl-5-hydroxy-6-metoxy-1,4-benzoquinol methylase